MKVWLQMEFKIATEIEFKKNGDYAYPYPELMPIPISSH